MSRTRFPKRCEAARLVVEALAAERYRAGWQFSTDPQSDLRPHYLVTGYVGPGGVIIVQDFYDPEEPTTDAVTVYAPISDSSRSADIIAAIRALGSRS